jgi:hypothetical protein
LHNGIRQDAGSRTVGPFGKQTNRTAPLAEGFSEPRRTPPTLEAWIGYALMVAYLGCTVFVVVAIAMEMMQ